MMHEPKALQSKAAFRLEFLQCFEEYYVNADWSDLTLEPAPGSWEALCETWKAEVLVTIDAMPDSCFPLNESHISTLWLETSDSYDIYETNLDPCGFTECFLMLRQSLEAWSQAEVGINPFS